MSGSKEFDTADVGKKLILSAIKMDEALADLLKLEASRMRKLLKNNSSTKDIEESCDIIRKIIYAIIITDNKIRQGMQLCNVKKSNKNI